MSSFIDNGSGLVLYIRMVCFSPSIEHQKHFIIEANNFGVVWYSSNNRVTSTKYIECINSIHSKGYSFYHVVLVKFYCDVITRSRSHIINTSIDTSLVNFMAFAEQRRRRKVSDGLKEDRWRSGQIFSGSKNL